MDLPKSLDEVRIASLPPCAYYVADFITEDEERGLLERIANAPKPRWKQLSHRRLQTWPSDLVRDALIPGPLPPWLTHPVVARLASLPVSDTESHVFAASPHGQPNHVLVNEYPPGVGIMPHKDGAAYYPVVCTVSLGASLCLDLYRTRDDGALEPEPAWRILQEPRSLLITTADLYTDYLHGIADVEHDTNLEPETVANWDLLRSPAEFSSGQNVRGTRTSLTYRDVLKVSKLGRLVGR